MADKKKVIKGLECCIRNTPECLFKDNPCPYVEECMRNDVEGTTALMRDALALLNAVENAREFLDTKTDWKPDCEDCNPDDPCECQLCRER